VRHRTEFVEIWLANSTGYLVSWIAFSFSFAAICFAVDEIRTGVTPSVTGSFGAIGHRLGAFLRISVLLFIFMLLAMGAGGLLLDGIFWVLRKGQVRPARFAFSVVTFSVFALLYSRCHGLGSRYLLFSWMTIPSGRQCSAVTS
jgi:hypothetical protein